MVGNIQIWIFVESSGFGLGLNFVFMLNLDLSLFKVVDLDLNSAGFLLKRPNCKLHSAVIKASVVFAYFISHLL